MVLQFGARDGGVWNRRVCVGSLENLDLRKLKVKNLGKYPRGSRGREGGSRGIVGRRGKVFMDWNLGTTKLSGK